MALGCGGKSAPKTVPVVAGADTTSSGARPGNEIDALWAAAPTDTIMGIVVAPGTTLKLYDMAEEILRVVAARPLGAKRLQDVRKEFSDIPFDIFDREALLSAGVDLTRGAALFIDAESKGTLILPVTNRETFREFTGASLGTVAGIEVDILDDQYYCTTQATRYVCKEDVEGLTSPPVANSISAFAERVYRLPSGYRGDVELVLDIEAFEQMEDENDPEFHELFGELGLLAAVLKLERGSLTARAWVQAKPRGDMQAIAQAGASVGGLSSGAGAMRPSSFARMIIPRQAFMDEVPDQILPGGASLRDDILGKLTGEIVGYTPASASPWGRIALGITEAKNFEALLTMGCALVPSMPFLEVESGPGRCSMIVDYDKAPGLDAEARAMFSGKIPMVLAVEPDQVTLTIGTEGPILESQTVSAIGKELLYKEWSYSLWTQNFSLISGLGEPWANVISRQPKEMQEGMRYALWLVSHVNEFAGAISVQADGMHMLAHIGSYASDSDEAYSAYQAAITKNIDQGDTTADFAQIRKRWPTSRAAQQSVGAGPFSEIFAKMIATISVPAFVKYMDRVTAKTAAESKTSN
tara:strand:+ start:87417 stop:89165 length:1749 start_codon:yes stop_codon:yes gene_type:complete